VFFLKFLNNPISPEKSVQATKVHNPGQYGIRQIGFRPKEGKEV
jgi:hypothetical protein